MFNISDYLGKFKKITPPDDVLKTYVIELCKDELGVELDKKSIEVRNRVIYLAVKPVVKSELFLKKPLLLKKIKEVSREKIIEDIR